MSKKVDKIEYYINGKLYGYSYFGADTYDMGREFWDEQGVSFFVGVCPWYNTGSLYYLKGTLYAIRLYEKPLNPEQVKLNYDVTLKYRDSFKNE